VAVADADQSKQLSNIRERVPGNCLSLPEVDSSSPFLWSVFRKMAARFAARWAVGTLLLAAAVLLVDASETNEWFVTERGVSSDVGEDARAGKPPLSPGMVVTLRGGSANHHCGDASGSTACKTKKPTEVSWLPLLLLPRFPLDRPCRS